MIGIMISLNNMLLIVQNQYIYYFGFVNGKHETSEMAFMVLAVLLYRRGYQSKTLACSQSLIGIMVSLNNRLLIVQNRYIYYFGFVNGKHEISETAIMVLAVLLYR